MSPSLLVTALLVGAPDADALAGRFDPTACAECHAALDDDHVVSFVDGSTRAAAVSRAALSGSVHEALECVDCHPGAGPYPHRERRLVTPRDLARELSEGCDRCHAEVSEGVRASIHGSQGAAGRAEAATCVDCHGGHAVTPPAERRGDVSARCGTCHDEVREVYAASAHGVGLLEEASEAAPTCTSCHGAHAIVDPDSAAWRASHAACARCHEDAEKMAEYDLSPDVVRTYRDDFHGMSNELFLESGKSSREVFATCAGCHGAHDVQSLRALEDPARAEHIDEMCERCHEGAPESFSDAWLGHRDISAATAPFAWLIEWLYIFMIPFILVALVVHILLDLSQARAREMTRRRKRP